MQTKNCPICNTRDNSLLIYKEKLPENLNDTNFAGRKIPDGYHYKMLRCLNCSLLYASEIYDEEYSNESDLEYVNCDSFVNQTIIKIAQGEESLISQDVENPFCYTITVAHCDDIVPVETFMVESIGAFMERDIFEPVENVSDANFSSDSSTNSS